MSGLGYTRALAKTKGRDEPFFTFFLCLSTKLYNMSEHRSIASSASSIKENDDTEVEFQ